MIFHTNYCLQLFLKNDSKFDEKLIAQNQHIIFRLGL